MPLSREELESIQADCMADDLEIDMDKMSLWTREQAAAYFESGEMPADEAGAATADSAEPATAPGPDPELVEMLQGAGLEHLVETVKGQTIDAWVQLFRGDRSKFLPMLKDIGIAKLPERQKIRDCIRDLATPPEGSKRQLREEYRDELSQFPWAVVTAAGFEPAHRARDDGQWEALQPARVRWQVEEEPFLVKNEIESMINRLPSANTLKKYVVRAGHTINIRMGRDNHTFLENGRMYEGGHVGERTRRALAGRAATRCT